MQLATIIILVFCTVSISTPLPKWNCEKSKWKETPEVHEGLFSATIQTLCEISKNRDDGVPWLFQKLQTEYQRQEKYEIHDGPISFNQGDATGIRYDLTDKLSDDGSEPAIRQNVVLVTNLKDELSYKTASTKIKASGLAAYLQFVSFETEVRALKDSYQVRIQNQVKVEKPWFALGFLFEPMSSSITEDKFLTARDRLIEYLLNRDGKTSPLE